MQSGSRLSPEELKRRNELPQEPPTAQTGQTQIHPTAEEWQELRGILWGMGELLGTQAIVLEELSRRLTTLPYSEQTRDAARDLAAIRKLLEQERQRQEQAGKKSGRRFSPRWPSLPLAPFEPGWLFLPLGLALLLAVLCCVLRLWTNGAVLT